MNDLLLHPEENDAPLVALVSKNPADMTDSELSALTTKLRTLRSTSTTRKKQTKTAADRKTKAQKVHVDLKSLFE